MHSTYIPLSGMAHFTFTCVLRSPVHVKLPCLYGLLTGERPFECRICKMAFTTNGNMHRHMRIHEKEMAGSSSMADPDSPQSTTTSPGSHSPRAKKRPFPRANGDSGGLPRSLFDDAKGLKRKLARSGSPAKKSCDGAVDLCKNKADPCMDEQISASSSDQVRLLRLSFLRLPRLSGISSLQVKRLGEKSVTEMTYFLLSGI